jgi:uncharacterized membrane protein
MNSPHVLSITRGLGWWTDAFSLFRKSFLTWMGIVLLLIIILLAIGLIPILGSLVSQVLTPVFLAGLMLGCRDQENGKPLGINHLFAGFSRQTGKLIALGASYIVIMIVLAIILGLLILVIPGGREIISDLVSGQSSFDEFMHSGDLQEIQPALQFFMIISLIGMALYLPILMAYWFAPALIILDELSIVEALKSSFTACLYNILPFTIYGLAGIIFTVIAAIPFGLGYIILIPVGFISIYKAYADIFHRQVQPAG